MIARWLGRQFHAELERIRARLTKLEAERAEREVELAGLLEQLHRHLLRMRQQARREREKHDRSDDTQGEFDGLDEVSRMILQRRRGA